MSYLRSGEDAPIDPANVEDLRTLFAAGGRVAVEVGHGDGPTLQATIIGGSSFILLIDRETGHTRKPVGKLDRYQTLSVFERYLESRELHPDYDWVDVDLPTVSSRGCRKSAAILLMALGIAFGILIAASQIL